MEITTSYQDAIIGEENARRCQERVKEVLELRDLTRRLQEKLETYATTATTAVEKFKKLEESYVQNQTLIENLRDFVAVESSANAALKKKAKDLEDENTKLKAESLKKDEDAKLFAEAVDSKIQLVYERYKEILGDFGVEPYDLPSVLNVPNFLGWLSEEFGSLSEVVTASQDIVAMICCDGLAKLIEAEAPEFFDRLAAKKFKFPEDLGPRSPRRSEAVEIIKRRFARDFWMVFGRETMKNLGLSSIDQENVAALNVEGAASQDNLGSVPDVSSQVEPGPAGVVAPASASEAPKSTGDA